MTDKTLTVEKVLVLINETKTAIKRADELIQQCAEAGIQAPKVLGMMAESASRLKDGLLVEIEQLEEILEKVENK